MSVNHSVRYSVKLALALGALAACGAGSFAAHAREAATVTAKTTGAKSTASASTAAKSTAAKVTNAKAPIVLAQTTPPPASSALPPPVLQTVVVTGTLIARPAAETAEAITIVQATALQNMGIVNVEQAMGTITSNNPNINVASSVGSFSGGGTYANMRGLGAARTLVLLDGQRLAGNAFNSNTNGSAVDLSGIPFSALESIQVLREGASALYGSDAIAGVINFITKKNYQGLEFDGTIDHPQEAGGGSGDANFTFGHGDLASDGYNLMITGSYSEQQELRATQRSFSAAGFYPDLGWAATNNPGTWPGTIADGRTGPLGPQLWQPDYPACTGNPFLTTYFGNCAYRYSAATDLLPKSDEASGMVSLTKALPDNNTLAVQYLYTRSKATGYSGPTFYGSFEMTPQADPTYYPTGAGLTCESYYTTCTEPPVLGGPITPIWTDPNNNRFSDNINTEQRILVSFSGENRGWDYKLNLNYSQNLNSDALTGGWPNESILAPTTDPVTGLPILSNLINPFGPQTAAGEALINSSYANGVYQTGKMRRWSVDANASHSLGDAFNSGEDAVLAFGISADGESYQDGTTPFNNQVVASLGLTDFAVEGARTTQAVFIELDVPMSKSLDVDISDRQDRYSDFGTTNNGKVKVRYQPFRFLTFRGAASTGFRAPTLFNLYESDFLAASTGATMGSGNPFCVPGNYNTEWSQLTCNSQGLGLDGGNNKLSPETSENFDFGIVLEPLRNLGITLDYYRILLKNTIGHIPAQSVYNDPTAFANYIVTNDQGTLTSSIDEPANCLPYTLPTCGYILLTEQNTGYITTDGLDLSVQYLQHTAFGTFREDLEGTSVTQYRLQQFSGGPVLNMVGAYNGGDLYQPALRWEHELRLDWSSPGNKWGAGLSNRFFSSYIDQYGTGPLNQGPLRTVGSQSTWDTYASFKPVAGLTVLVGIHNVLNTNPPFSNSTQNNFAAGYDALFSNPVLRDFYLNLKYQL
ncbi:MAG TPA: TonB-dependent receptor [Steroidobacteraceae bacterium]|nr:TonB-dependent receptor [Steroidobacteraceae bacterium]